jgi:3-phenylpropionate/trans-cinnamate dioxygenase ferredoxin reductase component
VESNPGILIVGGGLSAQRAAETLRRRGYDAPVRIVCAEPTPPYDRPPLSKKVLAGTAEDESVAYRQSSWYEENRIDLILGARAEALDPARSSITLDSGATLNYAKLLIATGASPRCLPFLDHANVHSLRTIEDARRLRADLVPGAHLAIVGAGFIGQEVAATARGLGAEVTIVEALGAPLEQILGSRLGGWFADLHQEEGVRVITEARLEGARGEERVEELIMADGCRLECDVVLVGIGSAPATAWLQGSGLEETGVQVDACGRTGIPEIYAAGDACIPFDLRHGAYVRSEHWGAAAWQGAAAAKAMLGDQPGTPPLPSFWSDQYGVRIQCVGHPHFADGFFFEGDPSTRDFQAILTQDTVPVAGLAVGRPEAMPELRRRIEAGTSRTADQKEVVV